MRGFLKRFMAPYRARVAIGILAKGVEVVFDLMTPVIVAQMIDLGVATRDVSAVLSRGALLVGLALVGYASTLVCQKMASIVAQGVGTDARGALFRAALSLPAREADRFGAPTLVTRLTSDVNQVQIAVALTIRQLLRWPLLAVGSMAAACLIDLRLGCVFLVCTPVIALVFWFVMSRAVPFYRVAQSRLDDVSRVCREALEGARPIRAFGRERHESERFRAASGRQAATTIGVGRLSALLNPATILVMNLGVVAILWSGAGAVDAGRLTQGQVVAFVSYMTQTLLSIVYLANLVVVFTRGAASAQRVCEVLDAADAANAAEKSLRLSRAASAMPEQASAAPHAPAPCALALDDVTFSFGGESPALSHVSLSLAPGSTLGVIGGTGSGKSTLVQLVSRLFDPDEGSVAVLGRDVRDWDLSELRRRVSVVPQQASLASGTIRSNLLWRDADATDDELWRALELAQAADFVRARPAGLDEPVAAGGRNFSGGQRQRLTIARALVGDPELLLLDDSASALDFVTDAALRRALGSLANTTCVIVSQRVSAVRSADLVLVLDHGRMAGLGTHDELLRDCGLYREICDSQLARGEVA